MALAVGIFSFGVIFGDLIIAGAGLGLVLFTIIASLQKRHEKSALKQKKSIPQRTMGRNTSQCQRHHRRKQHILQQACRFFPPSLFGFFPAHTRYGIAVALLHANNSPPVDVDKPPNDQATLKRRNLANNNRLDRAVHVA